MQSFSLERKLYNKTVRNMQSILEMHKLFKSYVKILLKLVKFINIINAKFA